MNTGSAGVDFSSFGNPRIATQQALVGESEKTERRSASKSLCSKSQIQEKRALSEHRR